MKNFLEVVKNGLILWSLIFGFIFGMFFPIYAAVKLTIYLLGGLW